MGMPSTTANYNKLNYYDVSPKIVRTGEATKITIKTKKFMTSAKLLSIQKLQALAIEQTTFIMAKMKN